MIQDGSVNQDSESSGIQQLLTVQKVAELLNCSVRQVQRLTKQSFLRCVRLKGNMRYRACSLEEDLAKLETAGFDLTILKRLKKSQGCLILDPVCFERVKSLAEDAGADPDVVLKVQPDVLGIASFLCHIYAPQSSWHASRCRHPSS